MFGSEDHCGLWSVVWSGERGYFSTDIIFIPPGGANVNNMTEHSLVSLVSSPLVLDTFYQAMVVYLNKKS